MKTTVLRPEVAEEEEEEEERWGGGGKRKIGRKREGNAARGTVCGPAERRTHARLQRIPPVSDRHADTHP